MDLDLSGIGMDDLAMNMQVAWLTRKPAKPPIAMAFPLRFLFLFDRETIGVAAGRFITGSAEMDFS